MLILLRGQRLVKPGSISEPEVGWEIGKLDCLAAIAKNLVSGWEIRHGNRILAVAGLDELC